MNFIGRQESFYIQSSLLLLSSMTAAMSSMLPLVLSDLWTTAVLVLLYIFAYDILRWRSRNPQFSGPRGLPIVGNLRQLNNVSPERLRQWSKR